MGKICRWRSGGSNSRDWVWFQCLDESVHVQGEGCRGPGWWSCRGPGVGGRSRRPCCRCRDGFQTRSHEVNKLRWTKDELRQKDTMTKTYKGSKTKDKKYEKTIHETKKASRRIPKQRNILITMCSSSKQVSHRSRKWGLGRQKKAFYCTAQVS